MRIRKTNYGWAGVLVSRRVYCVSSSDLELKRIALMSKTRRAIRTAFVGCMVLGLLFLQSAAVFLHHDCNHSQAVLSDAAAADSALCFIGLVQDIFHWHSHSGCHHLHDPSTENRYTEPSSSTPSLPHDSDDCRICQTLFAARITGSVVGCPEVTRIVIGLPDRDIPEPAVPQPYRLLSRGPPA